MSTCQQCSHIPRKIAVQRNLQASHMKIPQRLSQHAGSPPRTQPSGACEGIGCHVRALMVLHPPGSGMPTGMWSVQGALTSHCPLRPASPLWCIFVMPCAFIGAWQSVCALDGTMYRQVVPSWCILVLRALLSWCIFAMHALPSAHGRPCVSPGGAIYRKVAPLCHTFVMPCTSIGAWQSVCALAAQTTGRLCPCGAYLWMVHVFY